MAGKTSNSSLAKLAKYGAASAHAESKDTEVRLGAGGNLPEGIEMGAAQLIEVKIGEYGPDTQLKGEPYFMARAIVREPVEYDGMTTRIGPEPLCDTPDSQGKRKTFADHWDWMYNELKKLGAADALSAMEDPVNEIEGVMQALVESGVHIRFRTWKGKATPAFPNPRVNEEWRGVIVDYVPPDRSNNVEVENERAPANQPAKKSVVDKSKPTTAAPAKKAATKGIQRPSLDDEPLSDIASRAEEPDGKMEREYLTSRAVAAGIEQDVVENASDWSEVVSLIEAAENPGQTGDAGTEIDYAGLGATADEEFAEGTEGDACAELRTLAEGAGLDPDSYPTWGELATAIEEASGSGSVDDNTEPEPPQKGQVVKYHWYDVKTKKPAAKATDCEVVAVDVKNKTVTLKNLATKQMAQKIGFDQLS